MALPYGQQELPPPPPVSVNEQYFGTHRGRGSFGPVIGVLAVILILVVISVVVGRLCAGGKLPGLHRYDFEGWFQSKFGSCVDGRTGHPSPTPATPPQANGTPDGRSVPIVIPIEEPQAMKQPRKSQRPTSEITEL